MRMCAICGGALPAGSAASRKYCPDCKPLAEAKWRERNIERNRRRRERERMAKKTRAEFTQRDRDYCSKCVYGGPQGEYLCGYMLATGKRRGCDAGYRCGRRVIRGDVQP